MVLEPTVLLVYTKVVRAVLMSFREPSTCTLLVPSPVTVTFSGLVMEAVPAVEVMVTRKGEVLVGLAVSVTETARGPVRFRLPARKPKGAPAVEFGV